MKRYGNLYDRIMDLDNLRLADKKARLGKSKKYGVRKHDMHREENIAKLHDILVRCEYHTSPYKTETIYEPKERLIYKLPYYPDRIVHHAIVNICEPIWVKSFTRDTYANIKGRGIHKCAQAVKNALYKDCDGTRYCLKLDIRKYYPSVNHDILKREVRRNIKDMRLLKLLDEVIDSEKGLPIGNYLSQYFANIYLCRFDHKLKEKYKVKHYFRYVDDMVFLAGTKDELRHILDVVRESLSELRLELKPNWQIFPVDARGIDFLGYKFYHGYTLLRKSMKKKIFKRIGQFNRGEIKSDAFQKSMASWHGWIIWADTYRLRNKINDTIIKKEIQL